MGNAESKADVANAVDFVRAAMDFDWTWEVGDVQRFSETMGWKPAEFGTETTVVMLTKARLAKPFVTFDIADRKVDQVTVQLTDFVESSSRGFLMDVFNEACAPFIDVLGDPIVRAPGHNAKLLWKMPKFVGELVVLDRSVTASVVRPDYRLILDELQARGVL
ncbi:DUF6301 family protein [Nocardia pneumoniae]|uniref:DUF6301 family protein n=1 Tax=Nocardia pneumoniae TaxID=228601 RepID=UPI0002D2598E|nr:DUF6301 family protein [Nocardia pneumoniae]